VGDMEGGDMFVLCFDVHILCSYHMLILLSPLSIQTCDRTFGL